MKPSSAISRSASPRRATARTRACASCHVRFDSIGLVFEGYGPIGERRTKDLGGKPVETSATFPDGSDRAPGLEGLQEYLQDARQDDFVDNLCRKLLAYALGRTLMLSDDLLDRANAAKLERRMGIASEALVGVDHHQPAVSEQARAERTVAKGMSAMNSIDTKKLQRHRISPQNPSSRRGRGDGAAVAGIHPRLRR